MTVWNVCLHVFKEEEEEDDDDDDDQYRVTRAMRRIALMEPRYITDISIVKLVKL